MRFKKEVAFMKFLPEKVSQRVSLTAVALSLFVQSIPFPYHITYLLLLFQQVCDSRKYFSTFLYIILIYLNLWMIYLS